MGGMSFKEKTEHIWAYYKFPIFGGLFGLYLLFSVLNHYVFNPPADPVLDITVITAGGGIDQEDKEALIRTLGDVLVQDPKREKVHIEWLQVGNGKDPNLNMATEAIMAGKNEVGALDIYVAEIDRFKLLADGGFFVDLEAFGREYGYEIPETDDLVYSDEGGGLNGIAVTEFSVLADLFGDHKDDYYLGVCARSEQMPNSAVALELLK